VNKQRLLYDLPRLNVVKLHRERNDTPTYLNSLGLINIEFDYTVVCKDECAELR